MLALAALALPLLIQDKVSPLDITEIPIVYQTTGMAKVEVTSAVYKNVQGDARRVDFYLPAGHKKGAKLPAVVFCTQEAAKDWRGYQDWARLMAASGMVGVTAETRSASVTQDFGDLIAYLEEKGSEHDVDGAKLAIFAESANVQVGMPFVNGYQGRAIKCAVWVYGNGSSPVSIRKDIPILSLKAEDDNANFNNNIEQMWNLAKANAAPWTFEVVAKAPHAFEALDEKPTSVAAVGRIVRYCQEQLGVNHPIEPALPVTHHPGRPILTLTRSNRWADALPAIEALWKADGNDQVVANSLIQAFLAARKPQDAMIISTEAIAKWPASGQVWSARANALQANGDGAGVVAALEKAVAYGLDDPFTCLRLGVARLGQGQDLEAILPLVNAVRTFPGLSNAWYNLACAYSKTKQTDRALNALRRAIGTGRWTQAQLNGDVDFGNIRDDARFKELVATLPTGGN